MYPKQEKLDVGEENRESAGFDALGTTMMTSTDDQRGIWEIDVSAQQQNLLHEMNDNDPSMLYNDQFPQIPDFPCMSSSSSSSSNPAPVKPISSATTTSSASASSATSSTSSVASWAVLKSENDREDQLELEEIKVNRKKRSNRGFAPVVEMTATRVETVQVLETAVDGSGSIDCMDVMENFGYMDLIDGNELWDPSTIFEQNPPDMQQECLTGGGNSNGGSEVVQDCGGGRLDELGVMFMEWLQSNKEFISAEDMRNIKFKKSTVECASKRLGSSKEGKKQLLKLILEWVQEHQLQRKNSGCGDLLAAAAGPTNITATQFPLQHYQGPSPPPPPPPQTQSSLPHFNCSSWIPPNEINHGMVGSQWISPPVAYLSYTADQATNGGISMVPPPSTFPYMGGGGDLFNSGLNCHLNPYNNSGSGEYQVLESAPSWNPSQITMAASPYNTQFPDNYATQIMPLASGYHDQYTYNPVYAAGGGGGEQRLMKLGSSATKEARKKRMARQRRTFFHHHHHSRQNQHNHVANSDHHPQAMLVDDNCSGKSHGGNWLYWPSPMSTTTIPPPSMEVPQRQSSRPPQSGDRQSKQISSEKRRQGEKLNGLKTEKNLKFLLQKVLKQSDIGSLGRIVLPKKEAEIHLPDLESRDGITIAIEDIGTSQVWNMRYRFWPNNKSRMYLLENTGDFVKANGLQEGDFIVLYSDVKCDKYLIRGVKVRQPASGKSKDKKPVKRSFRSTSQSTKSSPSSPAKIPVS